MLTAGLSCTPARRGSGLSASPHQILGRLSVALAFHRWLPGAHPSKLRISRLRRRADAALEEAPRRRWWLSVREARTGNAFVASWLPLRLTTGQPPARIDAWRGLAASSFDARIAVPRRALSAPATSCLPAYLIFASFLSVAAGRAGVTNHDCNELSWTFLSA